MTQSQPIKLDIFKNKKWWNSLSPSELESYIDSVFYYYRSRGYPYYSVDVSKELERLKKSGNAKLDGKIIRQKMIGLSLAWSYHPHAVSVRNGDSLSPLEVFNDDELFRKCIEKRVRYGDNISDAAIRKSLRKYGGLGVSNFRPTSASFIYDYFGGSVVWDMSGGYGGRLLGAWMSKSVNRYIATEPCAPTVAGLIDMANDLEEHSNGKNFCVEIVKLGSEKYIPSGKVDLCFTSPPYFNQERYSDEPTQSYIKFPKYESWLDGYLKRTIVNCLACLKKTGTLVVNIANTKTCPYLESDFIKICKEVGFELIDVLYLELSAREHYTRDKSFKYEPVFVLKPSA